MSKFKTTIPVDVEAVRRLLPPGSYVDDVVFDDAGEQVELHWQHDAFKTPFDHAVEFSVDRLQAEAAKRAEAPPVTVTATAAAQLPPTVIGAESQPGQGVTEHLSDGTARTVPSEAASPADVPTSEPKTVAPKNRRR